MRTGSAPWSAVRGLIDGHMHMMAFEFLGGRVHCGRPWHPYGVAYAMVDCPDHYPNGAGAVGENVLSYGNPAHLHDPVGWPTFKDWPSYASLTHEQSYYRWLERSWRAGQRVFVNLLVDNAVLCELYPLKKNSCNEMDGVRLQARRIHELQDYIDAQTAARARAGSGSSPRRAQARRVINQGKLAVVLGIEVSKLFDCGLNNEQAECTAQQIDQRLDEVYDMGVRDMELVNKFDNALAGVAGDSGTTGVVVNAGNRIETGKFWQMTSLRRPQPRPGPHAVHVPGDRARLAGRQHPARLRPDRDRARLPAGAALQRPRALPARRPPRQADDRQEDDHRPRPPQRAGAPAAARHRRGRELLGDHLQPLLEHAGRDPADLQARRVRHAVRGRGQGLRRPVARAARSCATSASTRASAGART